MTGVQTCAFDLFEQLVAAADNPDVLIAARSTVESLIAHPATMTHASMSAEARATAGIGDGLLRLSVGIEALEDLTADLSAALTRASAAVESSAAFAT